MKRFISLILICALLCSAALADVPKLSENMFKYAKNALAALADGAYDKLVTALPFSDISPSSDEWEKLAEGAFTTLRDAEPQQLYCVAYWTGSAWKFAVPVSDPVSSDVEALILFSEDGKSFVGYGYSTWGKVKKEYQNADYVQWNEEYNASTSVVIEFDED